jgi:predicted nucleotidyltransferase
MGTDAHADPASRLLFGAVRREVLALLLGHPDERFYLREILRAAGGGSGAVQRELKQLVDAGLVEREASGHQVYFSANREASIFPELQAIVEKTAGAVDVLRASLASLLRRRRIEVALIYGSVASGRKTSQRDVDLLIVGDVTLADLVPALRTAEARLGREVNPTVYPVREFRDKLRRGTPFLKRILARPRLFVSGDDRELGRLSALTPSLSCLPAQPSPHARRHGPAAQRARRARTGRSVPGEGR